LHPAGDRRFSVRHLLDPPALQGTFAEDVRRGLSAEPKFLQPKYFYDALGSHLFEAICELPEYYLTGAERQILATQGDAIAAALPSPVRAVELGSGSAVKTRHLLAAILRRQGSLTFVPLDISPGVLERSARELVEAYPGLRVEALAADFDGGLRALAADGAGRRAGEHLAILFLGSTIGNLDPPAARRLLHRVRSLLDPGDVFLLGTDLKKDERILLPAYDDALGVTAAFNKNLLLRINRELGGDFDLDRFAHRVRYDRRRGRIEMHLESLVDQTVRLRQLDFSVRFAAGETIHTESSYKYDSEQIADLARRTGFRPAGAWYDRDRRFAVSLLETAGVDKLPA